MRVETKTIVRADVDEIKSLKDTAKFIDELIGLEAENESDYDVEYDLELECALQNLIDTCRLYST